MDVLYRRGHATAREVMSEMGGKQAYSTVRTPLRVLEQKGYVRHEAVGRMYVYTPVVPADTAQRAALQRVIDTFFSGSAADAIARLRSSQSLGSPRPQGARRFDGVAR
jgi:BlaI family penicillinase repressor